MSGLATTLVVAAVVAVAAGCLFFLANRRRDLGTVADRTTYSTLHTASLAAPPLRAGLTPASAGRSVRYLRALLGTPATALTDASQLLAWDGSGGAHAEHAVGIAGPTLAGGRTEVHGPRELACADPRCPIRHAIVAPLTVEDRVVGTLQVYATGTSANLVRATNEVARWASGQLELAELDRSRTRLAEAEVRALRAQISPHFIYNALTTIASFVRTDQDRARDLLVGFADFTRYTFQRHGDFTTLADELGSIDHYLLLERARLGDRLDVTLRIAPEVLPVAVPFLCLQPLVENAVRHGLASREGPGRLSIVADDMGNDCQICVEDDGVGEDPERMRAALGGHPGTDSVGLANVDERLRSVYGEEYGLVVETAVGAGTKVVMRVPKYRAGVHV